MRKLFLLHCGYESDDRSSGRMIFLTCKTEDGGTAVIKVVDWYPFFYVRGVSTETALDDVCEELRSRDVKYRKIVRRISLVGFTNDRPLPLAMIRIAKWGPYVSDSSLKARFLEHKIKPVTKFFVETGLRSGGWFEAPDGGDAHCASLRALADATPPRLTIMAYDLETSGLDAEKCKIHQCCCVFWDTGSPLGDDAVSGRDPRTVLLVTQDTASENGTSIVRCADENDLLRRLQGLIKRYGVDVLTGYNLSFDNKFIKKRWERLGRKADLTRLGRPFQAQSSFKEEILKSAALGTNDRTLWIIPGRMVLDLFLYAKTNFNGLPNFKLDTVAKKFVGGGKEEVPFGQILHAFSDAGTPEDRGRVAFYCEVDGFLCLQLIQKWSAHVACFEEASCCSVNASTVIDSGRQIKVISLLLSEVFGTHVYNPPPGAAEDDEDEGGYEGAIVVDTKAGFYGGACDQVVLLDFASLYPSCMRAHGVCSTRYVRDDKPEEVAASLEEGVRVAEHEVAAGKIVRIAHPPGDAKPPLTLTLEKLLAERKAVRALEKIETDPEVKKILDARQKAKKVACNSAYGLLGCRKGYLPLPDLAAVTTFEGRQALMFTKRVIEEEYGGNVVAGDTDSAMFILPPRQVEDPATRMRYVFEMADRIGDDVSSRLPAELILEPEGVMWPACFYKKKNYAAVLWERWERPNDKLKIKGNVAIRNDWSRLTKRLAIEVLDKSIKHNAPRDALAFLKGELRKMRAAELPLDDFVISKELHDMHPKTMSPHVALCHRLLSKTPELVPHLGAKVEYVIVRDSQEQPQEVDEAEAEDARWLVKSDAEEVAKKSKLDVSSKSKLPEHATVDEIDVDFYFYRQILEPIGNTLAPLLGMKESALKRELTHEHERQGTLQENGFEGRATTRRAEVAAPAPAKPSKKQKSMMSFFAPK